MQFKCIDTMRDGGTLAIELVSGNTIHYWWLPVVCILPKEYGPIRVDKDWDQSYFDAPPQVATVAELTKLLNTPLELPKDAFDRVQMERFWKQVEQQLLNTQ